MLDAGYNSLDTINTDSSSTRADAPVATPAGNDDAVFSYECRELSPMAYGGNFED